MTMSCIENQLYITSIEFHLYVNDLFPYQNLLEESQELDKLKNFSFDEWRQRYMKWHNHKKSRVNDFFRHQDKDHDGKLTRKEFIDGILGTRLRP